MYIEQLSSNGQLLFFLARKRKMNINEKNEYEIIDLGYEYPGMTGGVKWAVVTDLDWEVLEKRYEEGTTEDSGKYYRMLGCRFSML